MNHLLLTCSSSRLLSTDRFKSASWNLCTIEIAFKSGIKTGPGSSAFTIFKTGIKAVPWSSTVMFEFYMYSPPLTNDTHNLTVGDVFEMKETNGKKNG